MITISRKKSTDSDYMERLKNKSIHIVTFAQMGLTFSHEYLRSIIKDEKMLFDLISQVCRKKETGSLVPFANLTILPVEYLFYPVMGGEAISEKYSDEDYKNFLRDAIKAEIEYVKSGKMVFDFRDDKIQNKNGLYTLNSRLYNILEELLNSEYSQENIECIFLV